MVLRLLGHCRGVGLLLWGLAVLVGCRSPAPQPEAPPNILLVTMCTWRADHVHAYGYDRPTTPTLDRLAAQGVLFENAYSSSNWTNASVASLFTGTHPSTHGLIHTTNTFTYTGPTLPQVLGLHGFSTLQYLQGSGPATIGDESGLNQGFDWTANTVHGRIWSPGPLVEQLAGSPGPYFAHVHIRNTRLYPHHDAAPFADSVDARIQVWAEDTKHPYVDGTEYSQTAEAVLLRQLKQDPGLKENLLALYDAGVLRADGQLGTLLDALRDAGLLSNTIVVVVGDHGESLGENDQLLHGKTLDDAQVRVPLVVIAPGLQGGRRVADSVGHVDVAPTLYELAKVIPPAQMNGRRLVPLLTGGTLEPRPALSQIPDRTSPYEVRLLERVSLHPFAAYQLPGSGSWVATRREGDAEVDVTDQLLPEVGELMVWHEENGAPPGTAVSPRAVDGETKQKLQQEGYW